MVIRNRCSSGVEGSPSKCNLCRTSGRQRRVCPRIGQASASRPIVGPTSRPLKIKSDRVRKKKKKYVFRFRNPFEKHRDETVLLFRTRTNFSPFIPSAKALFCKKKKKRKEKRIAKKKEKSTKKETTRTMIERWNGDH